MTILTDPDTFIGDPALEPFRDMARAIIGSLQSDSEDVLTWLQAGLEAGGQLACITAMLAMVDYDNGVHPRHILANLWHAYDAASGQVTKGLLGDDRRDAMAMARPRCPAIFAEVKS